MKIMFNKVPDKYLFVVLFIIALCISSSFMIYSVHKGIEISSDNRYYFNLGKEFFEHGITNAYSKSMPDAGLIYVGPLEPLIIGLLIKLFGASWLPIRIFNLLVFSFIPLFIFKISIILKQRLPGLLSALAIIVYIPLLRSTLQAGKDLYMVLFLVIFVFLLLKLFENPNNILSYINLGVCLALAIHLDERFVILIPLLFIIYIYILTKKIPKILPKTIYSIFIIFLISAPWMIRNYIVYNKIVLLTIRLSPFIDPILGQPEFKNLGNYSSLFVVNEAQIDSIKAGTKVVYYGNYLQRPTEILPIHSSAIEAIKNNNIPHKFSKTERLFNSFREFYLPLTLKGHWSGIGYTYRPKYTIKGIIREILQYYIFLPFFFIGLVILYKRSRLQTILLLSVIIFYSGLCIIAVDFTLSRYRLPLDPIINLMAMIGLVWILNYMFYRRKLLGKKSYIEELAICSRRFKNKS